MPVLKNPIQMAVIGAPHGVKGEVRVKTFTEDPLGLGDYGPLCDADGRVFTLSDIRAAKNVVVVRFREVTSREQAEALNGTALFVDRSALPEQLEEEEFYHADLIGLHVEDETGETLGQVTAVHDFGGGDILEVSLSGKAVAMIPFTKAAVPTVDIAGKRLQVDLLAAGLAEGEEGAETESAEDDASERRPRENVRGTR